MSHPLPYFSASALLLLFFQFSFAQSLSYYPYHPTDTMPLYTLATQQRAMMRTFFEQPTGVSKEYRQAYSTLADEVTDNLYRTLRYQALRDTLIAPYVQHIFDKILAANPQLPPAHLVVVRRPVANAYAAGSGIIVCNVGLLAKLNNESQLAFVLGHELAHVYFNHMQQGLTEHFDTFYSRAFQKKIKKIQREEYNMRSKLHSLVQETSLNQLYHNRSYEQQADSLGYRLMTAAGFPGSQAYTALQLLDRIDVPSPEAAEALPDLFACSDTYPLWVDHAEPVSSSIFAVKEKQATAFELSDTLKTHPNCQARAHYIQQMVSAQSNTTVERGSPAFRRVRAASQLETIQSWFERQRYDQTLFEIWQQSTVPSTSDYLPAVTLLSLYKLKEHLLHHSYAHVVASPSDQRPESVNQFLRTLQALNLPDFARLASCVHELKQSVVDNEYILAADYAFYDLTKQAAKAAQTKEQYVARYPDGKLLPLLFSQ